MRILHTIFGKYFQKILGLSSLLIIAMSFFVSSGFAEEIFPENTKISVIGNNENISSLESEIIQHEVSLEENLVNSLDFPAGTIITDTFLYDTTLEENSAWRTDATKSWYTEEKDDAGENGVCDWKGADDRCGKNEFPEVALIVSTKDNVYIFDTEAREMWMRFSREWNGTWGNVSMVPADDINSLFAKDSSIYLGKAGLLIIDFSKDSAKGYATSSDGYRRGIFNGVISERQENLGFTPEGNRVIINNIINDIHARVINGKTYVAVATDGGISVINETDGTVVHSNIRTAMKNIFIDSEGFVSFESVENNTAYTMKIDGSEEKQIHNFLEFSHFLNGIQKNITNNFATLPLYGNTLGHWVDSLEDRSGKGNILTNVGNVAISPVANGAELKAFNFDGTNYLESDGKISGTAQDSLTYGLWFKTSSLGRQTLISEWEGEANFALDLIGGKIFVYLPPYAEDPSWKEASAVNLADDSWHFVVVEYNREKEIVFLDGKEIFSVEVFGDRGGFDKNFKLGANRNTAVGTYGSFFNGSIALPFVSSEAYTDEQIENLYNQTKDWFVEDAKITLQGNSDVVKDIACSENTDTCFISTDDGVITELNTETGITKLSEKTGTQISLTSGGNILGTVSESGKFAFAEEKNILVKTLENLPENTDFTVTLPAGMVLKNSENNHLKTDALGKLTFELQAEKTSQDSEKSITFFATENPDLSGAFSVKIWGVQGESEISSGISNNINFISGEKILDKTPEFLVEISGRNDDISNNIKSVLQISKTENFSAEDLVVEKVAEGFVTLPQERVEESLVNSLDFPAGTIITDTFLYDTSLEADSSWRTDSSKSWYTEEKDDAGENGVCDWKGADDRCGKSEFPEVALIVSTKDNVYIFDTETREMWMRFDEGGGYISGINSGSTMIWNPYMNISSIFALNGNLYIGKNGSSKNIEFAFAIDFQNDGATCYRTTNKQTWATNISERNTRVGYPNSEAGQWLIDNSVNDIHARVINGKTYVAVATDGGISVINETDGTVVHSKFRSSLSEIFITEDGWVYAQHYGGHDLVIKIKVDGSEESNIQRLYSVDENGDTIFSGFLNKKDSFGSAGIGNIFLSTAHQEFPRITQFFENSQKNITKDFATLPLYGNTLGHWVDSLEDRGGKGNDLTNVGNVEISPVANGAELKAFTFDGTNYLESDSEDFNITGNLITLSSWVNTRDDSNGYNGGRYGTILGKGVDNSYQLRVSSSDSFGTLVETDEGKFQVFDEDKFNNDEWIFTSMVYDGEVLKLFVNGELKNSIPATGNILSRDDLFIMGARTNGYNFYGKISLPFVSSEAYTDEQIENLYNQTKDWFVEDAKITLQGNSDVVKDIACSENTDTCFISTDDGVITELNTETGITKLSEKTGTQISLTSGGNILGTVSESGKFAFAEEKTLAIITHIQKISQTISLLITEQLEENIPYFARVKSVDEAGRVSEWSEVFAFEKEQDFSPKIGSFSLYEGGTEISIPTKGSTTAGTVDVSFLLKDDNEGQKLKYQVQISEVENFVTIFQDITGTDFVLAGKQLVSIPFLSPGQTYFIRVRGIDDGENIGSWTIPLSFSTEIKPPEDLFVQALEDISDADSLKKYRGKDVTFADRNPLFGFTLPTSEAIPIFLSRSISGKGVILYNEVSFEDGSFSQKQERLLFEGNTSKISETALSGVFKIGTKGYIYLNQDSAPAAYKSLFPADFVAVKNDTKGNFSQRAWSNVLGWVEFSSDESTPEKCETAQYFDGNNFFSCVDIYGKFQGYVKITHPVFTEDGLKQYFGEDWAEAKQYFINGEHYTKKILRPLITEETFSALEESVLKSKLQTLWQKEGGYLKFSDQKILALPEELSTEWKPDGLQKRLDIKAGIQNNALPKIDINTFNAFEGDENIDFTRNFSLVSLTGTRWEPIDHEQFDISQNTNKAEEMKQFLKNIPEGGILLLTTGKNPALGRDTWKSELLNFGATESLIDGLTENDSYIFVGRKGKTFPLYEDFSDEGNSEYSQTSAGATSIDESVGKNNLYYGGDTGGFVQTQNLGTLIFYDEANNISSDITGTEDLESATPENSGIIGTAFSTAAGKIYFDADGIHGATNNLTPNSDDYGVTIKSVDTQGNIFFSGRAWGDGIGFIEMSRGVSPEKCEKVENPDDVFGVCRDKDGAFHGYAWSPSFGWVSFENVYSHDPFLSSGYNFVLTGPKGITYEYSPRNITTGEIELPLFELQAHLKKNCEESPVSCLLPYGSYKWKVQTTIEDIVSDFSPEESFVLEALDPELTHQCLETIPLKTTFSFIGRDKNVPEIPLNYVIEFTDLSEHHYNIDDLFQLEYDTPENGEFETSEKNFSGLNGGNISYKITLQSEEKKESQILCENVPVRGMNVTLITPNDSDSVPANDPFSFEVETSPGDSYDYTIEFQENPENSSSSDFVWSDISGDTVVTQTGSYTLETGETLHRHTEEISGLEIDNSYCWRVSSLSQDGTQAVSDISCFSTQNGKPVISEVEVYGDSTLITAYTADTTPTFQFTVSDDSDSLTATITLYDDNNVEIQSFEATMVPDENNEAHFVMTLPDAQALVDFEKYTYIISVIDSGNNSEETETGDFILIAPASGEVGYGNIGTNYITVDNGEEKKNHRFTYDTEDNIGFIDFNPVSGGVHISAEKVYGYAFNTHTGWIRFNCSQNPTTSGVVSFVNTNEIHNIIDSDDAYCSENSARYGVKPGILNNNSGNFSKTIGGLRGTGANKTQDLLGKAKFEIFDEDRNKKTEFLYFDIATYIEDFGSGNIEVNNWLNNDHSAKAVGIDANGKISGYAWSPAFGWINMGRTQTSNQDWSLFYPITEYTPAEANCQPELLVSQATFLANESRSVVLANACSGETIESSSQLYWKKEGDSVVHNFSFGSGSETATFILSEPEKSGVTYVIWGNIIETSGAELVIPNTPEGAVKIKIIADPNPDFTLSLFEVVNTGGTGAFANGKNLNTFEFELRDRFGNKIFEDTDVTGVQAKEVTVSLSFRDDIRINQIANSVRGGAVSIMGAGITGVLKNGSLKTIPDFSVEESTSSFYSFSSYAPTGGEDTFDIESLKLTIKDLRENNESPIFDEKKFTREINSHSIKLGTEIDFVLKNTSVYFQKIFSGKSVFTNEIFDENSDENNVYTISLAQLFSDNANQLPQDTPFHFMHCLDADPEAGVLEFSPLKYKTVPSANFGKNCYEISSSSVNSHLSAPKNGRTDSDNSVDYFDTSETLPIANTGETDPAINSYLFETKASRIDGSLDIPDIISTHLYVAFENPLRTGEWIHYEIPDLSIQELRFIMKSGYIEGVTHGDFVYGSEVTNKEDGVFSQVGSIKKLAQLRNALTRNLAQYIAEEGGRQSTDLISGEVILESGVVSSWLKGEESAIVSFQTENANIKILDGGNMLWIRGENDFVVKLGSGTAIDDLGIGESKTIVVEGGNLYINGDIFRRGEGTLALIVLRHPDQLYTETQWEKSGNILIDHYVKNIRAMMYADGSLLSYGKKTTGSGVVETVYDGYDSDLVRKNLANQLYILGSVSSLNTYGGSASPRKLVDTVYVNTLSDRNVWKNSLFDENDTSLENLRSEAIRFDLKRLREFKPEKIFLDDADNDGIRDILEGGDAELLVCTTAQSAHETLPEYCVPQEGSYAGNNSAKPSFTDPSASWENETSLIKAQTSVIFEYDEQIQKNPAPGTVIFSELVLD